MPTRKPAAKGRAPTPAAGPRRGATKAQAEPADAWAALQAELAPFHPDADPKAGAAALQAARDRADASRRQQAETALGAARAELQGAEWVRVRSVATVVAGGDVDKATRIRRDLIDAARGRGLPVRASEPPHEPIDAESAASIGPMFELLAVLWWEDANALLAQHLRSAVRLSGPEHQPTAPLGTQRAQHNTKGTKRDALWSAIERAQREVAAREGDPLDPAAVFAELRSMAARKDRPAPLLGVDENAVKYDQAHTEDPGFLTLKVLRQRMNRANR